MDSRLGGSSVGAAGETEDRIFSDRFEHSGQGGPDFAGRVVDRLSYGARPQDLSEFLDLGKTPESRLAAYVDRQLDFGAIDDGDLDARLSGAGYQTLGKTISELWADHVRGSQNGWPERYLPVAETDAARLLRATYSRRQLYEMMVEFWHDHFNVAGWDFSIAPVFVQHDRDAIRPQALGNFRTLLESVAKSTAMLYYLDNRANRSGGYNENWARELMELHTLGVDVYFPGAVHGFIPVGDDGQAVGYSDADVYDVARCFTGWTVRDGHWQFPDGSEYDTGEYFYYANWHEEGPKFVLGQWIPPQGQLEAHVVMDRLASHSATARHVCRKLCRRFIDDSPPEDLVESAAAVWQANWQESDQIAQVMRHILTSDAMLAGAGDKTRRPFEMLAAGLRKTSAEIEPRHFDGWSPYGELLYRFEQTGHGSFRWPAPNGYPDSASRWTSASVMGQTWRLVSRLPELQENGDGAFLLPILDLSLNAFPQPVQQTAGNLVDWWLDRLIVGEVDAARRQELIDFLGQNALPDQPLNLGENPPHGVWRAGNLSEHYTPARLRALVALIMMLPEFHRR